MTHQPLPPNCSPIAIHIFSYVMAQAKPQLSRSTTGHGKNIRVDNVRTSKSAWLTRNHAGKGESVMDTIYRRIGIALKIPQELHNLH